MERKVPINRLNKFFSAEDYNLEVEFGREYTESDINMVVVLFQVDRNTTMSDDIYGESDNQGITYKPPVELHVNLLLETPENKSYNQNSGSLRYSQDGNLTFDVYTSELTELKAEIGYGDYIGYSVTETEMIYFSVVDDGLKNYDNKHSIGGYKSPYRTIVCAPIDENEFKSL